MVRGKDNTSHIENSSSSSIEILEHGEIFFFFRPKVETEHPNSISDVQKLYMVLKPEVGKRNEVIKQAHDSGKEGALSHGYEAQDSESMSKSKEDKNVKQQNQQKSMNYRHDKNDADQHSEKAESCSPEIKSEDCHDKKVPNVKTEDMSLKSNKEVQHTNNNYILDKDKGREGGHGEEKVNINKQQLFRYIVLGRKRLPDLSRRTKKPHWGFVELVTTNVKDIKEVLGPEEYETSTRGKRHVPAARPVAEGRCCILKHTKGKQMHTHLVYKLELPRADKSDSPQAELNIEEEGSFIIQVKNPRASEPRNAGLSKKRKATYPAYLQSTIGRHRFVSVYPCDFLNYEGCEFILLSASDLEQELGLDLDVEHDGSCSSLLNLFGKEGSPLNEKPLLEGEWA